MPCRLVRTGVPDPARGLQHRLPAGRHPARHLGPPGGSGRAPARTTSACPGSAASATTCSSSRSRSTSASRPRSSRACETAARFLHGQRLFDTKYLPYGSQLIPLAAILATLGNDAPGRRRPAEAGALVLVRRLRRALRRDDRDPVQPGPARGRGLDPQHRAAAAHRRRGPVRSRPPAHPPDSRQRRIQGHLRPAAQGRRHRLAHRRGRGHEHVLRRGHRHPPHLPEGMVRDARTSRRKRTTRSSTRPRSRHAPTG